MSGPISIEQGTAEETEEAVVEALQVLGEGGGLILSPVDNVRDNTENAWENTHVFLDTWKRYCSQQ